MINESMIITVALVQSYCHAAKTINLPGDRTAISMFCEGFVLPSSSYCLILLARMHFVPVGRLVKSP
jgi:hypothetical protein